MLTHKYDERSLSSKGLRVNGHIALQVSIFSCEPGRHEAYKLRGSSPNPIPRPRAEDQSETFQGGCTCSATWRTAQHLVMCSITVVAVIAKITATYLLKYFYGQGNFKHGNVCTFLGHVSLHPCKVTCCNALFALEDSPV